MDLIILALIILACIIVVCIILIFWLEKNKISIAKETDYIDFTNDSRGIPDFKIKNKYILNCNDLDTLKHRRDELKILRIKYLAIDAVTFFISPYILIVLALLLLLPSGYLIKSPYGNSFPFILSILTFTLAPVLNEVKVYIIKMSNGKLSGEMIAALSDTIYKLNRKIDNKSKK